MHFLIDEPYTELKLYNFIPLALMLTFYCAAMLWRSLRQARRYGASGLAFVAGNRLDNLLHTVMSGLTIVQLGQAAMHAVRAELLRPMFIVTVDFERWSLLLGALIVFASLVLIQTAQRQMGASWRMGIDYGSKPALVIHGLYRYTRNPIALGLMLAMVGFTFVLPTYLSLGLLAASLVGLRFEVAKEERHLLRTYGSRYENYRRKVHRFVPGIPRGTLTAYE